MNVNIRQWERGLKVLRRYRINFFLKIHEVESDLIRILLAG